MENKIPLYQFMVRYRWWLCVATLVSVGVMAMGLPRLGYDSSFRVFFPEDDANLIAYDKLGDQFKLYENLIFVVGVKEGDVYSEVNMNSLDKITNRSLLLPHVFQVSSLANYEHMEAGKETLQIAPLFDSNHQLTPKYLAGIREKALQDGLVLNRLVNKDGTLFVVFLDLGATYQAGDYDSIHEVLDAANALKAEVMAENPNLIIHLLGSVMDEASSMQVTTDDLIKLAPLVLLAGMLITYLISRSIAALVAGQATIFCAVLAGMGIAGWFGYDLNIVSAMAGLLIVILALADAVHLGTTFLDEWRSDVTKEEAMYLSIEKNFGAIVLTSMTTIGGFSSLNFVGSAAFADLGNIAIFGVLVALIFSFTLFPALLILLTRKQVTKDISSKRVAEWIADTSIAYRKPLSAFFFVLVIGLSPFLFLNQFNDDYREFFDEDMEIRKGIELLISGMQTSNHIEYTVDSGQQNGINNPELLAQVDSFLTWYKTQPGITHIYSYVDFMKQLNQSMHDGSAEWYKIPESQALASQYLLMYEMNGSTETLISFDKSILRIIVTADHLDNRAILALERRAQQWLIDNQMSIISKGVSLDILFANAGQQVVSAMKIGVVFTIFFITGAMIIGLRSLRYGLLSLIPNLVPALVVYGAWGLLSGEVDQGVAVTYSLSLGLIVDDTVHVMAKYVKARRSGQGREQSMKSALESTAIALINTTLVIGAGLYILSFSAFEPNANISAIMAPIIFLALVFDLFVLPGLIVYIDEKFDKSNEEDLEGKSRGILKAA